MKTHYLKDGTEVLLERELGNDEYLIQRFVKIIIEEGDEDWDLSGKTEYHKGVIYETPPINKVSKEIEQKKQKIKELDAQIKKGNEAVRKNTLALMRIEDNIKKLKSQETDIKNGILVIPEVKAATSIWYFTECSKFIVPGEFVRGAKNTETHSLTRTLHVSDSNRVYSNIYYQNDWSSDKVDEIFINKTEEEMIDISKERQSLLSDGEIINKMGCIRGSDDKWLSDRLLNFKKEAIVRLNKQQMEDKKNQIAKLKKEIDDLI